MAGRRMKIITVVVIILAGAIGVFLYFRYLHEPSGEYIVTNNPKLATIREDLDGLIKELEEKGLYDCCIRNDCKWCAIYMGHCPCAKLIRRKGNEKSCPECAAAWNRKLGRIPGVDPNAIEVTTFGIYGFEKGGHHHEEERGGIMI